MKEIVTVESTDRYQSLGLPYPDPATMCEDQCEGTGIVPVYRGDPEEPWLTLWMEAEAQQHAEDGWHFVPCPACKGTGRRV